MSDRKAAMVQDRYLRDSAKALVEADIDHLKTEFAYKGLTERAMDRVVGGATELYEDAVDIAEDNKGALAALLAALVVWFARNPILGLFGVERDDDETDDEDRSEH